MKERPTDNLILLFPFAMFGLWLGTVLVAYALGGFLAAGLVILAWALLVLALIKSPE